MHNDVTILPSEAEIKQRSRARAREILGECSSYHSMPIADQKSVYLSMVEDEMAKLRAQLGIPTARQMATDSGKEMGFKGYDPGLSGDTRAFTELVESVDFPKFVADLLKAVFDANLKVMKQQTDSYIKLMKEATKSTADFIKKVKDDDALAKLAETHSDKYNITTEKNADGSSKLALTTPDGDKVDPEDAAVKRALFEAKLKMAQEHRAALREVLLMGVTRLVVKNGEIEAGVEFSVKATRASQATHRDENINVATLHGELDIGIFSMNVDVTNTNIQVNTAEKKATDDLSATLKGKVKIVFGTDYFKLDNFASMYADGGVAALKPPAPGGVPALPAQAAR